MTIGPGGGALSLACMLACPIAGLTAAPPRAARASAAATAACSCSAVDGVELVMRKRGSRAFSPTSSRVVMLTSDGGTAGAGLAAGAAEPTGTGVGAGVGGAGAGAAGAPIPTAGRVESSSR